MTDAQIDKALLPVWKWVREQSEIDQAHEEEWRATRRAMMLVTQHYRTCIRVLQNPQWRQTKAED